MIAILEKYDPELGELAPSGEIPFKRRALFSGVAVDMTFVALFANAIFGTRTGSTAAVAEWRVRLGA